MKKRNVKLIVLIEFVLFLIVFVYTIVACQGAEGLVREISWFIDMPSITIILLMTIPGLVIMGVWRDFLRAFSVGQKPYTLMELKNINEAVAACQKLIICAGVFELLISLVILMGQLSSPETIGPNLAICILSCFYAALFEYLILPVRLNVIKRINEELDFDSEASEQTNVTAVVPGASDAE